MTSLVKKLLSPFILYKRIISVVLTFLIALSCFGLYLMLTPQGAKMTLYFLSEVSGYKLTFKSIEGNLTHHIKMRDLHFQSQALDIEAQLLDLKWDFKIFFKKEKILQSLKAHHLKITSKIDASLSKQPTFKELQTLLVQAIPIPLQIQTLQLQDVIIYVNHQAHEVKTLTIKQATSSLQFEEIHYQGSFGKLEAYLQDTIKIKWHLYFMPPLFLQHYFSSDWISTKGEIHLPHRKIEDWENYLDIHFKTNALSFKEYDLQNVDFTLKGTPTQHQFNAKAVYDNKPIDILLNGMLAQSGWQGKIQSLKIKNHKWLEKGKIEGQAKIDWHKENIQALLDLKVFEKYPLKIACDVSKQKPYALKGTLQSRLNDVKTLNFLFPAASNVHGKLDLNLLLSGSLFSPTLYGNLVLSEGGLKATAYGSKISLNRLQVNLDENKALKINGEGLFGKGHFSIQGDGTFAEQTPSLSLKLKGKSLLLSDTPEFTIVADPDLTLIIDKGVPKLIGTIFVPKAEILSLKNANAITPSSDVVIVKKGQPFKNTSSTRTSQLPLIPAQIEIVLGNEITYKGHGVTTKVRGKLEITQMPNELPLAKGQFTLHDGKYHAYGKQFDVHYGQILFTGGPIDSPILDIQAQRKVKSKTPSSFFNRSKENFGNGQLSNEKPRYKNKSAEDVIVGVKLTGNVKSPRLDFFSSPSMPEADVLSYLVVGRPQSEINDAQAEILFQAATQLAGFLSKSGNAPKLNIAEQLKLDQFGLSKKSLSYATTTNSNSTSSKNMLEDTVFVLGKQLSDRLYLHYSVGILDSASNFGLRYSLGKNLMLEAATGSQGSSADVLLSFEGR